MNNIVALYEYIRNRIFRIFNQPPMWFARYLIRLILMAGIPFSIVTEYENWLGASSIKASTYTALRPTANRQADG
jgi:hypothetical protein